MFMYMQDCCCSIVILLQMDEWIGAKKLSPLFVIIDLPFIV